MMNRKEIQMAETTITNTAQSTVTLQDVLRVLFPASRAGYLRLVAGSDSDRFFRPSGESWVALDQERGSIGDFVCANPADVAFPPCAWSRPTWPTPMTACACLWVSIRLGLAGQQRPEPRPRILDGERERALESFTRSPRFGWPPALV